MPESTTIKLFASLRKDLGKKEVLIELTGSDSVQTILERMNINHEDRLLILINGIHCGREHTIESGDIISLFPLVGGG